MGPLATTTLANTSNFLDLSATRYHLTIPSHPSSTLRASILFPQAAGTTHVYWLRVGSEGNVQACQTIAGVVRRSHHAESRRRLAEGHDHSRGAEKGRLFSGRMSNNGRSK